MRKVLVYGSLKQGYGNHRVMQEAGGELIGKHTLSGFDMHSLGGFPAIVRGEGRVECEVYQVENLAPLDRLEGHPTFYKREVVDDMYVYIFQHSVEGREKVESGVW